MGEQGMYSQIIEKIFFSRFTAGMRDVGFEREDIVRVSKELKIALPKNLGDLVYSANRAGFCGLRSQIPFIDMSVNSGALYGC